MVQTEDRILVELPVEKEFARLLRLLVSGIASRMSFDLDAVDDLKIAVEEAFLMAMRRQVQSPVKVSFLIGDDALQIDLKGHVGPVRQKDHGSQTFGNFILEAVVDEISDGGIGETFDLRLTKKV